MGTVIAHPSLSPELRRELEIEAEIEQSRRRLLDFVRFTFPGYVPGWVHEELCLALEWMESEIRAGRSPRLIVQAPPRHGKSEIVSRRFPIWFMGRNPKLFGAPRTEVVIASYGAELAIDHSRDARELARAPLIERIFPRMLPRRKRRRHARDYRRADVDKVSGWADGRGSTYRAVGVDGALTGKGAHLLIIDDPVKDAAEALSKTKRDAVWSWYQTTSSTRVAPGGGVLLTLTRWHKDDLAGRILAADKSKRWKVLNFAAIAEEDEYRAEWLAEIHGPKLLRRKGEALHAERWPLDRLEEAREISGPWWDALFMGRPTSEGGKVFRRKWLGNRYDFDPRREDFDEILLSADLPFRKDDDADTDFAVFAAWGLRGTKKYLLDVVRDRMEYVEQRQAARDFARRWARADVFLVEGRANGDALLSDLEDEIPILERVLPRNIAQRKVIDAKVASVHFARGEVFLPESAPWLHDWIEEHADFTGKGAAHDDQVDTTSQALLWWDAQDREFDLEDDLDALEAALGAFAA